MNSDNKEVDVYALVTELCQRILDKHSPEQHLYLPRKDNTATLKKLRGKAFEILLSKSGKSYDVGNSRDVDPIVELLKYSFILKTALQCRSKAEELEHLLDQLSLSKADADPGVYSVLQFLNGLKSYEIKDDNELKIFHYGKPNELLPEEIQSQKEVPHYQVYPMEAFVVSERFEAMLGTHRDCFLRDKNMNHCSNLSFGTQFSSAAIAGIESVGSRSEQAIGLLDAPKYVVNLVSVQGIPSFFSLPQIDENQDERNNFMSESEFPWLSMIPAASRDGENSSKMSDDVIETDEDIEDSIFETWDDYLDSTEVPERRTWETLGHLETPKELPFITESSEAILHLERLRQAGFLSLLSRNVVDSFCTITEIPTKEFIENVKLLLLGAESSTFIWRDTVGFCLKDNTTIRGLSAEALKSACTDVMFWGTCYRLLSLLIKPDSQTDKMQQEGLIFRAMCNSVKEVLLYYQVAILRTNVEGEDSRALLKLLNNVTPVGSLIAEVARLCRCDTGKQGSLGEGFGLLSHIYEQVRQITKPNVALVFFSILKSCCEIYFRFLQKWIFEGTCDDVYGEFMIKVRPQYLHHKGHRFWTKAFTINTKSVPRFLKKLTEPILQCGKTVRLLKICDPKHPLCVLFATSHPAVRACLSAGMVREQEIICHEFYDKGNRILGENSSFIFAFEEQRIAEKNRADLVINAQRDTLMRLKREREEAKIEVARNKRELLAQLKDQAEEVASRKERERKAELLQDKQYLKDINAAEELARNAELAEKQHVLDYYNELAADVERNRARANWRIRRMKLFQQRADSINEAKKEFCEITNIDRAVEPTATTAEAKGAEAKGEEIVDESDATKPESIVAVAEDENQNHEIDSKEICKTNEAQSPDFLVAETPESIGENVSELIKKVIDIAPKKSPRPCVLDINKSRMMSGSTLSNLNECPEIMDVGTRNVTDRPQDLQLNTNNNRTVAQLNKLKVLEQEYGMTPNNNELNIIVVDAQGNTNTISIDKTTVNVDDMRRITEMETDRNRNRNTRHQTDSWATEEPRRNIEDENLVDIEKNRNRYITDYNEELDGLTKSNRIMEGANFTDAQKNRRRIMSHTYRDACPDKDPVGRVNFANFTDMQKNRARVMGHDNRNYQDYVPDDLQTEPIRLDAQTPLSQATQDDFNGATPMSCTTDTFPLSMSSSMTQCQNSEEDFFNESKSVFKSCTTPGDLASEGLLESRPTSSAFNFSQGSPTFPNFFGSNTAATPTFESSFPVVGVEMINASLEVYLEKSVATPLRIQNRLANAAVIKYLLYEYKLLSHLHSLRSFYFLLNGEFAKSLTGSLFKRLYAVSMPIELFNSVTLTNLLETALNSSLSSTYANSENLSLSVMDIPSQLQVSNPEALDCLCLKYKVSWPLNIILDENLMQQYSKVFKFLLMVGRVLYVLQEDFHILKVERKAAKSDQYHKLQLYRHSMMQFVTALHNYLTCSVLHASWAEFEKDLESATTVDQIYMTHVAYIKKILSRCMLTTRGEKMRIFLCNVFKVILKFHNRVRSQSWSSSDEGYTHENFERLEQMYQAFCDLRMYLAHVANKLASSGYQPHLTYFLNALNINPLYDLTEKETVKKS